CREVGLLREQEGRVVQPGLVLAGVPELGGDLEYEGRMPWAAEDRAVAALPEGVGAEQVEADAVAVERGHPVEVGDLEGHRAHAGAGGEDVLRVRRHGAS